MENCDTKSIELVELLVELQVLRRKGNKEKPTNDYLSRSREKKTYGLKAAISKVSAKK